MEPKQFHRRVLAVVLALALAYGALGSELYDLQVNNGAELRRKSQYKIAETETVEAARGQILDRNGKVLVSNKVIYQVTLNTKLMGDDRNDTLRTLLQICREQGVEWEDTLPISRQAPFTFTTDAPYYTVTTGDDGTETVSLTRLGRLAVAMKWIKDPTKQPEALPEVTEPKKPGLLERIKALFTGGSDAKNETPAEESTALPDATELLGLMCRSFQLKGEGAVDEKAAKEKGDPIPALNLGDMDPAEARSVAGVLYELYLRARDINRNVYVFAQGVDIGFITRVKELGLSGVVIDTTSVREYHTPYAAHLLGQVSGIFAAEWDDYKDIDRDGDGVADYAMNDTVGKSGVEWAFESYLRGKSGVRTLERNTSGKVVSETWLSEPIPGNNVMLTLDIDLQGAVEDILAASLKKLESKEVKGAACVVLDVNDADVLAAASYPTYDITTMNKNWDALSTDPLKPLMNRAFQGLYPPGSTFKMITAIAGLEEGLITPSTTLRDEGIYTYYKSPQPKCWIYRQHGRTHGVVNVSKAIEVSCNYFFYDLGRRLGIERLDDYASRFGLGQTTGLELGEKAGTLAGPAFTESLGGTWYEGSTLSVAIGQESTQVTPIQLASYIATLVNGGTRRATHLLKEVKSGDFSKTVYDYEPKVLSTIEIQDKNLKAVKAGMLALTTEGSVKRAFQDLGVQVGAKTGSAQVSAKTNSNAVFVCFAPFDDPQIAVALVVERGGSGSDLGSMAAEILSYYFNHQETAEPPTRENTLVQ